MSKHPFRVVWTRPPRQYLHSPVYLQRPAAFLVYDTPTLSKREHLRLLWLDWLDAYPPPPLPPVSRPRTTAPDYVLKRRKGEPEDLYTLRVNAWAARHRYGTHTRRQRNPYAVPPCRFIPWSHPYEACGPVYDPTHPRHAENTPWAWRDNPDAATVAAWMDRPAPPPPPPPSRVYSYRVPAVQIRGVDPSEVHIPPLSFLAAATREPLARWLSHARPFLALAGADYEPRRLPRGTQRLYVGLSSRPLPPPPPPMVSPWTMDDPDPVDTLDADTSAPAPAPTPQRVSTESPIYLAEEDAEAATLDRRTAAYWEHIESRIAHGSP